MSEALFPEQSRNILIFDDDDRILILLKKAFGSYGYKVLTASRAKEVFEISEQLKNSIDLFISDINIPNMNGFEVFKEIRSSQTTMKVLFMSGDSTKIEDCSFQGDIVSFISKPFSIKLLLQKVKEILF